MKLNLLIFFLEIFNIRLVFSFPFKLEKFSEIKLVEGESEYLYHYSNYIFDKSKTHYFFIKLTDNEKVDLRIYLNKDEQYFSLPKNDEWIDFSISNEINDANITLKIITKERNLKMLFIDSIGVKSLSLKQFLNLNLETTKLYKQPLELQFYITVDKDIHFGIQEESNYTTYNDKKLLKYYNVGFEYIGSNHFKLIKDKKYIFELNYYQDKDRYFFKRVKILYYMEEVYVKNNTFTFNHFTQNNYLILKIQNYQNISFYLNDNSGIFHQKYKMITISNNQFDTFIKEIYESIPYDFKLVTNGKINNISNNLDNGYLIIDINNNKNKNKQGFILFFNENIEIFDENFFSIEINKGKYALIHINKKNRGYSSIGVLVSSNKNMKLLLKSDTEFTNKITLNNEDNYIYIDSSKSNTKFISQIFNTDSIHLYNNKFLDNNNLKYFLNKNNDHRFFIRKASNNEDSGFFSYYFFDIEEEYYIYTKKYFGKINLFKYKNFIHYETKINEFMNPISYYDMNNYEIMNNKLIILSGTQFYNYYLNYGSLFDFYIQRVKDNFYIDINKEENKYSRNTVYLLNKEKIYHINFELNHLIKIENDTLDIYITFINKDTNEEYNFGGSNKILYLKGNNFLVKSNNNKALIYFYEKIENYNNESVIEFDESKIGKNMIIKINNKGEDDIKIAIAKDFGFKSYYPMINFNNLEIVTIPGKKSSEIYIENYYDLLELKLIYEKYYIYLFEVQEDNKLILLNKKYIEISPPLYFDSITKFSKFNFELIPSGKQSLLLKLSNEFKINYNFIKCSEYDNDINFKVKTIDAKGETSGLYEKRINDEKYFSMKFKEGQTLIHYFESKNEFLFLSDYSYKNDYINYDFSSIEKYEIKFVTLSDKNILSIGFTPPYDQYAEYYIIVGRKNEFNNLYTFSNPCYLTKLILNISESSEFCFKRVYHYYHDLILEEIDIGKIRNDRNDIYVINIISYNMDLHNHLIIYSPVIFNQKYQHKNIIKLKFFQEHYFFPEKDIFIYEHLSDEELILHLYINDKMNLRVIQCNESNENNKIIYYNFDDLHEIIFDKKGKYYLEFDPIEVFGKSETTNTYFLYTWIFNQMIEEIDLTNDIYYGFFLRYLNNLPHKYDNNNLPYYKISNIKEDKLVYFTYDNSIYSPIIYEKDSPFIICKNKKDECIKNILSYIFLKENEYTIYIDINNKNMRTHWNYAFFPALQNITITKEGHYTIDSPKIITKIEKNINFYFVNILFYIVCSDGMNKEISQYIHYHKLNDNNLLFFYIEKDFKYKSIIIIPEQNNKSKHLFITNTYFEDSMEINILKGQNVLIYKDFTKGRNDYELESFNNYFETFTSPIDNIKFISLQNNNNNQYQNFIYNHFGKKLIYIDNLDNDKDIIIKKNSYEPKYIYFSILNDETVKYFKSLAEYHDIYINKRINTARREIFDYINLYIDKFNKKYNLYIKKYYGPIKLYESNFILDNISNFDILTKPINNIKKKKSIFNRIIQINKNQLISGYISSNSFLDIYLEEDNDNKDIYLSEFKNRKYLKKGIEYKFHFNLYHLIKLEPQFKAKVEIYNEDNYIILSQKNQPIILIGNNFKMVSNESVMVYFYPKTQKFQKRIEPNKGEIIEIIRKGNIGFRYIIDFGFEGFGPLNTFDNFESKFYLENIYDKLEVKLAKGEYLYIYYDALDENIFEINYINNTIITSSFQYNFNLIKHNATKNEFIIPNINIMKTKLTIYQCKSPYGISIRYGKYESEKLFEGIIEKNYNLYSDNNVEKFFYETKNDFILSYFYGDIKDDYIAKNEKWEKDRIKYNSLTINKIKFINKSIININFNTNYKYSLTRYFIIITSEEKNNTIENFKNICFLTELINQKEKGGNIIIEEIYDIGENDTIEVSIEISKIESINKKYIMNIISEELRFGKKLMFYEPKQFYMEENFSFRKIILIFCVIFVFLLIAIYFRKSCNKINLKKIKRKRYEENLGEELNNIKVF